MNKAEEQVQAVKSAEQIMALARSRSPGDRERLLMALADLCDAKRLTGASAAQALLQEIFLGLVAQAEHDIRMRLAERLARAPWAPHALIQALSMDSIDIARPVIAHSPLLQDADLLRLLVEATIEHHIEVASRPAIGPAVVGAILDGAEPPVLTALAANESAEIEPEQMQRLVAHAQRIAALRAPLSQHPRLTVELAGMLYQWVGQALRSSLTERFAVDAERLQRLLSGAVQEAYAGVGPAPSSSEDAERADMETKLVAKLQAAGQLRPGYLLRALREEKLGLFAAALAALGGFSPREVERALNARTPELLALGCASVGIDRSVFPTLLSLVRNLNEGRPEGEAEVHQWLHVWFGETGATAADAFRRRAAQV